MPSGVRLQIVESQITFRPIEILTDGVDHEGCLVLADGVLVAVLVLLADPVYEPPVRGSWYLEIGFGAALDMRHDVFVTLDDAADMIGSELSK